MKILLISNMYPDAHSMVRGIFVRNIEGQLIESGFDVRRVALSNSENVVWKLIHYLLYFGSILWNGVVRDYQYIYLHYGSHNAIPMILLKWMRPKCKIVYHVHGSDILPSTNILRFLLPWTKALLHIVDTVVVPSRYFRSVLSDQFLIPDEKIRVYPSGGIDRSIFYPILEKTSLRTELGIPTGGFILGFVGNISAVKGCWTLYHALRKLIVWNEQYRVIYIGSGPDKEDLKQQSRSDGISDNVIFIEPKTQTILGRYYNIFDLFIFPTLRREESLGLVGLEAMACGVPVIGSRIGGLVDYIVDGKNGFFIEPNDADELAEKIKRYLLLPKHEKSEIIREAENTAHQFDAVRVRKTLVEIFH